MPQASSHVRTNHLFHRYWYELSYPLCCEGIGEEILQDCLQDVILHNVNYDSALIISAECPQ